MLIAETLVLEATTTRIMKNPFFQPQIKPQISHVLQSPLQHLEQLLAFQLSVGQQGCAFLLQ